MFKTLKEAGLLTEDNIKSIIEHPDQSAIESAIKTLKEANALTADNIKNILNHPWPSNIPAGLKNLKEDNILTPDNIKSTIKNRWPLDMAFAVKSLKDDDLLTSDNIKIVLDSCCHSPSFMAVAIKILKDANILTPDNIKVIREHPVPFSISQILTVLKDANILTLDNIKIICDYKNPIVLSYALSKISECNLVTQDNIQHLLNNLDILLSLRFNRYNTNDYYYTDTYDVSEKYNENNVFSILPKHLITQKVFDDLIQLNVYVKGQNINVQIDLGDYDIEYNNHDEQGQNFNLQIQLERYIEYLLFKALRDRSDLPLTNSQNTHTVNVHQSASASAKKLDEHYQDQLNNNADQVISKLEKYKTNLGDSLNGKSVKTCIKQIIQGKIEFYDSSSGVTLLIILFHLTLLLINAWLFQNRGRKL